MVIDGISVRNMRRLRRAALLASAVCVTVVSPALAQDAQEGSGANDAEAIVVTGSRLRQTDLVAAAPVTIMDAEDIDKTGAQSVGELLRELPVASPSTSESGGRGNDGSATVALRGLDAVNTLVLLNGRRLLSNNAGGTVDLNSVPFDAVERVEILQNGASAIYGTDAVAGVVNMITRRDYDGIKLRAGTGISSRGDLPSFELSGTFGKKYSTGGFIFNVSFRKSGGNLIADRPVSLDPDWRATGGRNFRDSAPLSTAFKGLDPADPNRALIIREGVTQATSLSDFRDYIFPATGTPISTGNDGINYFEYESSASKISQLNLWFAGHQDLTDNISAFAEVSYNKRKSLGFFAPDYFIFSNQNIVSANNDFNPFGRDVAAARTLLEVTRTGVPRSKDVDSELYRVVAGLQGKIGSNWDWELSGNYQKLDYYSYGGRGVQRARLRIAIGDSDICRATPGCVPMNLFGATGSVTDEMLKFVTVDRFTDISSELKSVVGNVSGTLLQLPAGDLNISIGGEYRTESFAQIQDDQIDKTTRTPPFLPPTRKVSEVYGELGIPVLRDIPFIYRLDIDAAVRFSHYNAFGNTTNPQVSVRWRPYQDLLIRGSWSSAFRAPNFTEANTTQSRSARPVNDPCASAAFATFPGCNGRLAEVNTSTPIITGGNPDLRPETAKSMTAGFVFTPSFVPRLSLTVDFYKIKKSDIIGIADPEYIVQQNASGAGYTNAVLRSPVNNSITDILSIRENLLTLKVQGVDIGAEYTTAEASWGRLNFRADATYLDSYTQSPAPGTPPVERSGSYTTAIGTLAKWRASGRATWSLDNVALTYGMRYVGGVVNEASLLVNGKHLQAESYLQHDLMLSAEIGSRMKMAVGVENVTDEMPPFLEGNYYNGFDNLTFSSRGRFFYTRVELTF
jgi:iron complex outermembrane recepter protein